MLFTHVTYIGIDPSAGQRPITYAALDGELKLLALGAGSLEEVSAFTAGQDRAFVAVCAPRRPNQGLLARLDVRANLSPPPAPGKWTNFRVCEYLIRKHNLHIPRTPGEKEKPPNWMLTGFQLFKRLDGLGYQAYPSEAAGRQSLEVYPHASFTAMLGLIPFSKLTLEGRLQRQLALHEADLRVPDPMRFFEEITRYRLLKGILPLEDLYTTPVLDALVAAYTAWLAANRPGETSRIGDPLEGEIVLPVRELKQRYA
jgi:hypothetical protein